MASRPHWGVLLIPEVRPSTYYRFRDISDIQILEFLFCFKGIQSTCENSLKIENVMTYTEARKEKWRTKMYFLDNNAEKILIHFRTFQKSKPADFVLNHK